MKIEVFNNLWVGDQASFDHPTPDMIDWAVVHACKDPYHRQLLGYTGKGAPKEHPEYLFAERGSILYLNMVDAPNPLYIPSTIVDKALDFMHRHIAQNRAVLVHCNWGESRSPSLALLYMAKHTDVLGTDISKAMETFNGLYQGGFHPGKGMLGYIQENWAKYSDRGKA
jgi:hypothetical protein